MRDNCFRADGTPRAITGARFNVLGPDRILWELVGDVDVLNHSEIVRAADLPAVFEITQSLLQEAADAQKEAAPLAAAIGQQTDCVPGRLDRKD